MLGGEEFLPSTVSHWVSLDPQNMISWDLSQSFEAVFSGLFCCPNGPRASSPGRGKATYSAVGR